MTRTQELIVVEQLPVIVERLKVVSDKIDERISSAMALECTEDTVQEVKRLRADLNNDFKGWEDRRKAVKSSIMSPYEAFEDAYKQHVSNKYRDADTALKERVGMVEGLLKQEKEDGLRAFSSKLPKKQPVNNLNIF